MNEDWAPSERIFVGKAEEFPKQAYRRLKKRGIVCTDYTVMIQIYPPDAVLSQFTHHPICSITAWQLGGNRSRLEFNLLSFKGVTGDWASVREPIEQLLDDLRRDGLLEPLEPQAKEAISEEIETPKDIQAISDSFRARLSNTHKRIFDLWREGMTDMKIKAIVNLSRGRIQTLISEWRREISNGYGEDIAAKVLPYKKRHS
jgi:hypothetical protein